MIFWFDPSAVRKGAKAYTVCVFFPLFASLEDNWRVEKGQALSSMRDGPPPAFFHETLHPVLGSVSTCEGSFAANEVKEEDDGAELAVEVLVAGVKTPGNTLNSPL